MNCEYDSEGRALCNDCGRPETPECSIDTYDDYVMLCCECAEMRIEAAWASTCHGHPTMSAEERNR